MHELVKIILFFALITCKRVLATNDCLINGVDFSPLNGSTWNASISYKKQNSLMRLSFCSPFTIDNCTNSIACKVNESLNENIVSYTKHAVNIAHTSASGMFWLYMTGDYCKPNYKKRIIIKFKCGPLLGSPKFSYSFDCDLFFSWQSIIACKKPSFNVKQVPCYVFDSQNQKRDLSPLIKISGAYEIATVLPWTEFVINVCAGIASEKDNSSASFLIGNRAYTFGRPTSPLQITKEDLLELTYETTDQDLTPEGCSSKPKTKIIFSCPSKRMGEGRPKLISWNNCDYIIEWKTEYACPVKTLEGDTRTCSFNTQIHGLDMDLKSLTKTQAPYYNVTAVLNGTDANIILNVCDSIINMTCGGKSWRANSVCLVYKNITSVLLGQITQQVLRYSDGLLSLEYGNGQNCSSVDNTPLKTFITFQCDSTTDGNTGPTFDRYEDCTYFLTWKTSLACIKPAQKCFLNTKNATIDLSILIKSSDSEPWQVIEALSPEQKSNDTIFMNICGYLPKNTTIKGCDERSSICAIDNDGSVKNLGSTVESLQYNNYSGETIMEYGEGGKCTEEDSYKTTITFVCKPGILNSPPTLVRKSENGCNYHFLWRTSAACFLGKFVGTDCRVTNENLGINYDLSMLQKNTGYKVEHGNYVFYLNVCKGLKNAPCSNEASSCQTQANDENKKWSLGKPNSTVVYQNGLLSLLYTDGALYSTGRPRKTQISFLCDSEAGIGHPTYVDEQNESYIFDWHTSFACAAPPIECMAVEPSTGLQYDLSKVNGVRYVYFKDENRTLKFYVSVCQQLTLTEVPANCSSKASACLSELTDNQEKVLIDDLGQFIEPPKFAGPEHLSLVYTSDKTCVQYGEEKNITTTIQFICQEDELLDDTPALISKVGNCAFMFVWPTSAACAIKELEVKKLCIVKDSVTGNQYDLSGLHKFGFYTVKYEQTEFQINFCGSATNSACSPSSSKTTNTVSVCLKTEDGAAQSIGMTSSMTLKYSTENIVSMEYTGKSDTMDTKVVIRFKCARESKSGDPIFIGLEDQDTYVFEMKTGHVCGSSHVECILNDVYGNEYDLTPLAKMEYSNWMIRDHRSQNQLKIYHINVCRPLVQDTAFLCPGGPVGSCQTDLSKPTEVGLNLGYVRSPPEILSNSSIILRYTDGSPCYNGQFKRSTRIVFICSHIQERPVFVGETSECEYIFSILTPAGCPLQREFGKDCRVNDPLFGNHFDLNTLHNANKDYEVTSGSHNYQLNVCGSLVNGVGNCKTAGVCQVDSEININAGNPSSELMFDDGQLRLTYSGGQNNCHGKYNRKSLINFVCDRKLNQEGPQFISETGDCTYIFEWKTKVACPPYTETGCSINDEQGNGYDLWPLSLADDNYYVSPTNLPNTKFVINVCRNVAPKKGIHCPYASASCLIHLNKTNPYERFENLGEIVPNTFPYFEDGKIVLKYDHGKLCETNSNVETIFTSTKIVLECDSESLNTIPEYVSYDRESCQHLFTWKTNYACAVFDPEAGTNDCKAKNPHTDYEFNLNPMKITNGYKVPSHGHDFILNVCDRISDTKCGNNSGACQEERAGKRSWNTGNFNARLNFRDGYLFLNYKDGAKCHDGKFDRNTVIHFVCGDSDSSKPVFISESDDCTYYFMWHTKLACESEILNCEAPNGPNGKATDLSPLVRSSDRGFHAGTSLIDDSVFYINLCRPLNPIPDVMCPPGAAICKDSVSGPPLNLGQAIHRPFYDFQGNLITIFSNGSICPSDPSRTISSVIYFKCKNSGSDSNPVLIEVDGCNYMFDWETSIVCLDELPEVVNTTCSYQNKKRNINLDLTSLTITQRPVYEVDTDDGKFEINICKTVLQKKDMACSGAAVCLNNKTGKSISYGALNHQSFQFISETSRLKVQYAEGDDCPQGVDGKKSTEIEFYCNPVGGRGQPKLKNRYSCLMQFEWGTNLLCGIKKEECLITHNSQSYDLTILSSISHNWKIEDSLGNKFWLNVCGGIRDSPDIFFCPSSAGACYQPKNDDESSIYMIGVAASQQLSINENGTLQMVYSDGLQNACKKKRTDNNLSTTKILFYCSNTTDFPKHVSSDMNECIFTFHWNTTAACPSKRIYLKEENGVISLPGFNLNINFSQEFSRDFKAYEVLRNEKHKRTNYTYYINLNSSHSEVTSDKCKNAAICQSSGSSFFRNVGSRNIKQFSIKGSELQLEIISEESSCGKKPGRNVTSRIIFSCSSELQNPEFLFETTGCDYIFRWPTPTACIDAALMSKIVGPRTKDDKPPYDANDSSNHVVAIVVSFFIVIVMIVILIGIFYKEERRSAFCTSVKRCYRSTGIPTFHYSKVGSFLLHPRSTTEADVIV